MTFPSDNTRSKKSTPGKPGRPRGNASTGRSPPASGNGGDRPTAGANANGGGQLVPQDDAALRANLADLEARGVDVAALVARFGAVAEGLGGLAGDLNNVVGQIGTMSASLDATDAAVRQLQERQERQEQERQEQEQERGPIELFLREMHGELTGEATTLAVVLDRFVDRVAAQRNADRARIAALEEEVAQLCLIVARLEQEEQEEQELELDE